MSEVTTAQRNDLKTCPFCGTKAIEKAAMANSTTGLRWWILCGNPFCELQCSTHPCASRAQAESAWQQRDDGAQMGILGEGSSHEANQGAQEEGKE